MNTQHTGGDTAKARANYCELRTQTQGIGTMNENHKNNMFLEFKFVCLFLTRVRPRRGVSDLL